MFSGRKTMMLKNILLFGKIERAATIRRELAKQAECPGSNRPCKVKQDGVKPREKKI